MKAKIIIVGTCHHLQCGSNKYSSDQIAKFKELINTTCDKHKIKLIAEEMNKSCLKLYDTKFTVASKVAKELKIEHSYVEMENRIRTLLTIDRMSLNSIAKNMSVCKRDEILNLLERKLSDPIRERYWLTSILKINVWPALMICGANHAGNLQDLINSVGMGPIQSWLDYTLEEIS